MCQLHCRPRDAQTAKSCITTDALRYSSPKPVISSQRQGGSRAGQRGSVVTFVISCRLNTEHGPKFSVSRHLQLPAYLG